MSRTRFVYFIFLLAAALLSACGGVAVSGTGTPEGLPQAGATQVVTPTLEIMPTTIVTPTEVVVSTPAGTGQGATAQTLADAGKLVYADKCAACHGQNGEGGAGPALIGTTADLTKFANATELLTFVQTHVQENVSGGMTEEEILQVVAYILVENNLVPGDTPLDITSLPNISIP
jgi:mono/diheme cytochrome c family protein